MTWVLATMLLAVAAPFVLWPLLARPPAEPRSPRTGAPRHREGG
ncbi:MAG TPA: hypothetical protein VGO86_05730 [Candidatus Dormibacteraeota bacterium]